MQLDEHPLVASSEDEDGCREGAGDGEYRIHVPGALPEPVPRETDDADDNVRNEHASQREEDVIC